MIVHFKKLCYTGFCSYEMLVADPGSDRGGGANLLLPPANEVWGELIFFHLCVILFTGGICPTPPLDADPPPGVGQTPLYADSPPSPKVGQTPWMQTPRVGQTLPPPPDTVNKRAVRILLQCILVWHNFCRKLHENEKHWTQGGLHVPHAP